MIDNKKIKDVAKLHAEKSYISDYFQACYKDGFIDCAKWMGVSFNDGKDDTVMIKSVDELQHILFGLQLDSNLKI